VFGNDTDAVQLGGIMISKAINAKDAAGWDRRQANGPGWGIKDVRFVTTV
jgi:hypothetical protein